MTFPVIPAKAGIQVPLEADIVLVRDSSLRRNDEIGLLNCLIIKCQHNLGGMGAIVAIGGGDVRNLATQPIDIEIIRLSGKSSPNALFIPTASSDSVEYWEGFDRAYRENYGCATDVLFLLGSAPSLYVDRGEVIERRLPVTAKYLPIETLYER